MVDQIRTYVDATRYTVEGDNRIHTDFDKIQKIGSAIPNYWEDTCPECGNKENLSGCRCMISHRVCPCGFMWHWEVDKQKGILKVVV